MEDLRYNISADVSKFKAGMQEVKESTKSVNETLKSLRNTLIGVFSGIMVGSFIKSTIDAEIKQQKAVNQLAQALKNQGVYSKEAMKQWEQYASSLQKVTTFGDEEIMQAQSLAASFGLTGNKLKEVTKAALDFSAANNVDLDTSMELLGRAFAGNTQSLTRYGIVIDTTKNKSQQFSEIIKQINQRFGGQAEMLAHTYGGQLQQFANAWGDLKETIGFAILPTLTKLTNALKNLFVELQNPQKALRDLKNWFTHLPTWTKWVLGLGTAFTVFITIGILLSKVGTIWTLFTKLIVRGGKLIAAVSKLVFGKWTLIILGVAAAAFVLYTAWVHNWFGIRTITLTVWKTIYPVFVKMWNWISKGWNWTINVVGKGWDWLTQTAIPWIGKTFTTAWNWTVNAAGTFVEELTTARDFIDKTAVTVWNWTANVSGKFWNWWSNTTIGKYIDNAVSTTWSWIVSGLGNAWNWLIKDVPTLLKDTFTTLWKWSISGFEYFINNVVPWIQNAFSTTWTWIVSGLATIVRMLPIWLKPAFSTAWNWTIKGLSWFVETVSPWLRVAFTTTWDWTVKGVEWFVSDVVPWLSSAFKTAWLWTVSGLTWITNSVFPYMKNALSTAWSWTVSGLSWFETYIAPKLISTFSTAWDWTVSGLDWFAKNVLPKLGKEFSQLWSWTISTSGEFVKWLPNAEKWVGSALSTTWNWVSSGLNAIIESVDKYASKPLKTVWDFATKNFDSIKKSIDAIGKYTGKSFETVWDWTVKGADFIEKLLGDPKNIQTAWKGLSKWFNINVWTPIENAASASVQGIEKVWNGLVDVMRSAGQKVASALAAPLNYAIKALNVAIKGMNLIPGVHIPLIQEIVIEPEKKAFGGLIVGPGGPTDDKIPALLSNGEYVVPAWMVQKYKGLIGTIESIRVRGYSHGQYVGVGSLGLSNISLESPMHPDFWGDLKETYRQGASLINHALDSFMGKLGLSTKGLDDLNNKLQKSSNTLKKSNDKNKKLNEQVAQTTDKFASLKQAIANASEMFTYDKDKGLQLAGVMKDIATQNWAGALADFGAEVINSSANMKNLSAVINPFLTIAKGLSVGLSWLDKALQPLAKALFGLGKSIGELFILLLPPIKSFVNLIAFAVDTISWVIDMFVLGVNLVLSLFGKGFLTQDQIKEMEKNPQQRLEESEKDTPQTGKTYSAGSTQPIYNNFTIIFKDNEILSDDSPAVAHLADLFIEYVKSHGGVAVFS